MNIPFLDLKAAYLELRDEIDSAIHRVLDSGWYVLGEEVENFEAEFAEYCGVKHAIGVGNGLEALHLALRAMGIGPGDEVIAPSNTYIATWLAITHSGAKIVPVEPNSVTHNLDPELIERAITAKTKAILPVHLYGLPAEMKPINEVASKYGLRVLEDAAQAHGASYMGQRIGGHGDAVAWSFYPSKNLGAMGDAGAVTTDDDDIAETLRKLRNYGTQSRYINIIQGFNSRLDPLQAAVLRAKLPYLDRWNARRSSIASRYISALSSAGGIILPQVPNTSSPSWHLFVIRHPRRDILAERLSKRGIGTIVHYPVPPHMQLAYKGVGWPVEQFPLASQLGGEVLSLPIGPQMTEHHVDYVVQTICEEAASI